MIGDRTNALYSINTVTGVATRVGVSNNFGIAEASPGGLASYRGSLYMVGRTQGLSVLNTTSGAATDIDAALSGLGDGSALAHGLARHGEVVYAIADRTNALYSIDVSTGRGTRVGAAVAFGVGETDPRALASHGGKLLMVGNTQDALYEINVPAPVEAAHSFAIVAANGGYNAPSRQGTIAAGYSAAYNTPGGDAATVIHCRSVGAELNFALSGGQITVVEDFPTRIVATKLTGGIVTREFTPQAGSFRPIRGGIRQDYDPTSGAIGDVFVNGQTIYVELYY